MSESTVRNPTPLVPDRMAILAYHGVDSTPSPVTISPEEFAWQMGWLHRRGFRALSLGGYLAGRGAAGNGAWRGVRRAVVLTFDDGLASVYAHAFPILQQYGFTATVFLVTGRMGGDNAWPGQPAGIPHLPMLNWAQVERMAAEGIEFGAHTASHPYLDALPLHQAHDEIVASKRALEDGLQRPVETFCYPYGRYNAAVREIVGQSFRAACATRLGLAGPASDPLALERVDANVLRAPWAFRLLATPRLEAYLRARRAARKVGNVALRREWR